MFMDDDDDDKFFVDKFLCALHIGCDEMMYEPSMEKKKIEMK